MKSLRLLAGVAVVALCATLSAQQSNTGYHTVACFKAKPGHMAEFNKYLSDELHKVAQGRVDAGELSMFLLARAVVPQGTSADCDYLFVAMFPGAPHMMSDANLAAGIKKAGLTITPADYVAHRTALSDLVSVAIMQTAINVGTQKKGDIVQVNYMKVPANGLEDWVAYEKKVWQPLVEAYVKEGLENGWSLNIQVMPGGADLPYQAVTVDVFPSFESIFANDPKFAERWKKVHPDMELGTTFEQFERLRSRSSYRLFEVVDVVTPTK